MHRAGASPRTIQTALSSLFGPTDHVMLCWQLGSLLLFFVSFSEQASLVRFGSILLHIPKYALLTTDSAVSKPHPTEGAEIYYCCIQAAGILAAT